MHAMSTHVGVGASCIAVSALIQNTRRRLCIAHFRPRSLTPSACARVSCISSPALIHSRRCLTPQALDEERAQVLKNIEDKKKAGGGVIAAAPSAGAIEAKKTAKA
jgi:hypothetical protein